VGAWGDFITDLDRYCVTLQRSRLGAYLLAQGAQACLCYRYGHWLFVECSPKNPLVLVAKVFYMIWLRWTEITTGISIEPKATIGAGLFIAHFGGIIVGSDVVMGTNCNISQGVTLGVDGRGENRGSPTLGNRVFVGPGAKVLGKIMIGSDAAIGANAVVTKDVPERAVAVGVPAKVISDKGSFDAISYHGMEADAERMASLQMLNPHPLASSPLHGEEESQEN
jgi:serine O-acetyltransferase